MIRRRSAFGLGLGVALILSAHVLPTAVFARATSLAASAGFSDDSRVAAPQWALSPSAVPGNAVATGNLALTSGAATDGAVTRGAPSNSSGAVLDSHIAKLESESKELQRTLLTRGRAYVRLVGLGLLPVGGGIDALVTHATQVELLKTTLERAIERQKSVAVELETLKKQREALRKQDANQALALPEINDAERGEAAILAARERELAFQRAFGGSSDNDPHATVYGSMAHVAKDVQRFADLKGRLPIPVEGRAEVREVEADDARGPGLSFHASLGTEALAVYDGRVAMVGEYGGLGLAILLEHDTGYSTLYGSLTQARVEVGQRVNAGAVLGNLAKAASGSRLYFEIRRDVDRLQPAEWVGLQGVAR